MELANKLFKGDRVIWIIYIFLCLISLIEVFSATSTLAYKSANYWKPVADHSLFLLGGFALVLVLHHLPSHFLSTLILLLPVSIVLLIVTPIFGEKTNDAHRFLNLFGIISFQPSELAKLGSVVFVAFLLSKQEEYGANSVFKYILIGVGLACAFIFLDNISTSAILFVICLLMMFIGQIPFKKLSLLILSVIVLGAIFIALLFILPDDVLKVAGRRMPTAKERIHNFFEEKPPLDASTYKITDDNYQVSHAQIAIANGGLFGKLPGHGQQRDFLPQAFSDFIYAIIIEELGIVLGGGLVLLAYVILMMRVGLIARKCDKLFPKYLVIGCGLMIVVQAFANMAVAVGLFPVTGQPLPLVSRGGTSMIISCIYIGIILSVSRFGAGMGNEEEEEEDDLQPEFMEIETDIADDSSLTAIETLTEKK
ncbi:MAG: FtsW/RodA/SpoVE family cell cycle protein [Tannerellaceae bacterium]|jgi:cell division protein FtsW|nr:FtsW/RodA/SpoVE family cell cycle protein [Tannerellaceae bacterium]